MEARKKDMQSLFFRGRKVHFMDPTEPLRQSRQRCLHDSRFRALIDAELLI